MKTQLLLKIIRNSVHSLRNQSPMYAQWNYIKPAQYNRIGTEEFDVRICNNNLEMTDHDWCFYPPARQLFFS